MSLQWTLIAVFLYTEIAIIMLLLMPFISPRMWQKLFKSKFHRSITNQGNMYFMVFIIILILFFLDAVREMYKYDSNRQHEADHGHLDAELQHSMRLFRAQRNFYISGFSLLLCFVIRRLITLVCNQATLLAQNEASMKQAQSATLTAEKLLKEKSDKSSGENADNVQKETYEKDIKGLKGMIEKITEERDYAKKDVDSMKKQAESVTQEYDRLLLEHSTLQNKWDQVAGEAGVKKDD